VVFVTKNGITEKFVILQIPQDMETVSAYCYSDVCYSNNWGRLSVSRRDHCNFVVMVPNPNLDKTSSSYTRTIVMRTPYSLPATVTSAATLNSFKKHL